MRDKKIHTCCSTGYRGNIAADELVKDRSMQSHLMTYTLLNSKFFMYSKLFLLEKNLEIQLDTESINFRRN